MYSIIIPTFNNLEYLKICLNSIQKNSTYNHEVIIHINEGIDGTFDYVKKININIHTAKLTWVYVLLLMRQLNYRKINM